MRLHGVKPVPSRWRTARRTATWKTPEREQFRNLCAIVGLHCVASGPWTRHVLLTREKARFLRVLTIQTREDRAPLHFAAVLAYG